MWLNIISVKNIFLSKLFLCVITNIKLLIFYQAGEVINKQQSVFKGLLQLFLILVINSFIS